MRFAELRSHHASFRSFNVGFKTDSWCGSCPKCLSTFIVLAPFMSIQRLCDIFGENLLEKKELEPLRRDLLDEGGEKPFECVATRPELRAALDLLESRRLEASTVAVMRARGSYELVPEALCERLDALFEPRVAPLLANSKACVLGFGVEDASTLQYLAGSEAPRSIAVVDRDPEARYKSAVKGANAHCESFLGARAFDDVDLSEFDIAFRSPGIPPSHPALSFPRGRRPIATSNTKLFFEVCKGTTIGVTGTKGKSTTTALIHHVLRAWGADATLVGNMEIACLDGLRNHDENAIFCMEFSSVQLRDLQKSPDIA